MLASAIAERGCFMKTIHVNGEPFQVIPLRGRGVEPGDVVGQRFGRRVYRVLCTDGDDFILRNVRNESIVIALTQREVVEEFGLVKPI